MGDLIQLGASIDPTGAKSGGNEVKKTLADLQAEAKKTKDSFKEVGTAGKSAMADLKAGADSGKQSFTSVGDYAEKAIAKVLGLSKALKEYRDAESAKAASQGVLNKAFDVGAIAAPTIQAAKEAYASLLQKEMVIENQLADSRRKILVLDIEEAELTRILTAEKLKLVEAELALKAAKSSTGYNKILAVEAAQREVNLAKVAVAGTTGGISDIRGERAVVAKQMAQEEAALNQVMKEGKVVTQALAQEETLLASSFAGAFSGALKFQGMLIALTAIVLLAGAAVVTLSLATKGIEEAAGRQDLGVGFMAFANSTEEAEKHLNSLRAISESTPLKFDSLVQASTRMRAVDIELSAVGDRMLRLGAIAAATPNIEQSMTNLVQAYTRAHETNLISMRDLVTFKQAGLDVIGILAKSQGVGADAVRQRIKDQKVGFDELDAAIVKATSAGGQFADQLGARSLTVKSLWIETKQTFDSILESFGKPILDPLGQAIQFVQQNMIGLKETAHGVGDEIALFIKAIKDYFESGDRFDVWKNAFKVVVMEMMTFFTDQITSILSKLMAGPLSIAKPSNIQSVVDFFSGSPFEHGGNNDEQAMRGAGAKVSDNFFQGMIDSMRAQTDNAVKQLQASLELIRQTAASGGDALMPGGGTRWAPTVGGAALDPGGAPTVASLGGPTRKTPGGGGGKDKDLQTDSLIMQKYLEEVEGLKSAWDANDMSATEYYRRVAELQDKTSKKLTVPTNYAEQLGAFTTAERERERIAKDTDQKIKAGDVDVANSFIFGIQKATEKYRNESQIWMQIGEDVSKSFASGWSNAFVDWITGVKSAGAAFKDFAYSFLRDISTMILKMYTLRALAGLTNNFGAGGATTSGISGLYSLFSSGIFSVGHTGGMVGSLSATRADYGGNWAGAPRFHSGGVVGGERRIIAQDGEGIFTPDQMTSLAPVGSGSSVTSVHIEAHYHAADGTGSATTKTGGKGGAGEIELARGLGAAVNVELRKQQRHNGTLNAYSR